MNADIPSNPVVCRRCMCEIKTLVNVPHTEFECIDALKNEVSRLTEMLAQSFADETSGELEQLRRIDRAARAFVDNFPSSYVDDGNCRKEWRALNDALFDGRPPSRTSERRCHCGKLAWPPGEIIMLRDRSEFDHYPETPCEQEEAEGLSEKA